MGPSTELGRMPNVFCLNAHFVVRSYCLGVAREVNTNTGTRAFHSCAPSLCSNLLLSVRSATSKRI